MRPRSVARSRTARRLGDALAFTGFGVLLVAGTGGLLVFFGLGLLAWRRRLAARR